MTALERVRRGSAPLGVWALALSATAVAGATAAAAAVLHALDRLATATVGALAAGLGVGLVLSLVSALAAARVGAALSAVHADGPAHGPSRTGRLTRELAELAGVVDTLRWRARTAEALAERRRREAATAPAGVQELVSGLVAAEEGARGQLAAELHDTVAQSLMLARALLAGRPTTAAELDRLADHVEDAEEQVRAVMARTRPPALRDGDLAEAVSCLRADFAARYGLAVEVDWPATPVPLPLAAAVTVYRFFSEGLLNVVKHADVDRVQLALEVRPDGVVASVADAGPGFEPELVRTELGRHVGLGLLGDRARLSGGRLEVRSGGGCEGTLLRLWLPRPAPATTAPPEFGDLSTLSTRRAG